MKNPLTPKQTIDKNGKHTTVHVNENSYVAHDARLTNMMASVKVDPTLYRRRPPYGVTLKTFTDFVGNADAFNNHDITRRLEFIHDALKDKNDDELVPELADELEMMSYIHDDYHRHLAPDEKLDFNISDPTVSNVREAVDILTPKFHSRGGIGGIEFIRRDTAVERVREGIKEGLEGNVGNFELQKYVLKSLDLNGIVENYFRYRQLDNISIDGTLFTHSDMKRPDEED